MIPSLTFMFFPFVSHESVASIQSTMIQYRTLNLRVAITL